MLLDTLRTCPIPEVKGLGKTLRRWREEILAHGFSKLTNYRIRIPLTADGSRPYGRRPPITPEPG